MYIRFPKLINFMSVIYLRIIYVSSPARHKYYVQHREQLISSNVRSCLY